KRHSLIVALTRFPTAAPLRSFLPAASSGVSRAILMKDKYQKPRTEQFVLRHQKQKNQSNRVRVRQI
ncbi:hypothetical protein, partial [Abditibacterium utsteinense]|uniref:hypothetical protein n=1 Tax=Abditibacterium utsteinense TaxID=1960156 RepID=UPI001EE76FF6